MSARGGRIGALATVRVRRPDASVQHHGHGHRDGQTRAHAQYHCRVAATESSRSFKFVSVLARFCPQTVKPPSSRALPPWSAAAQGWAHGYSNI